MAPLSDYAVVAEISQSRQFAEPEHPYRAPFERDRDRIIHSLAFRRLEGKTQVFTPGLNDHYRTRSTHSIEVAHIGRTAARTLNLNEDLTEAICLGHDLGHSPFGHAGEAALNEIMADFGGFEHNNQTLRIVDLLEHPYPDFMGLNLMYETRLGFAKHRSTYDNPADNSFKFKENNCSLEGQIADLADRIAYNCHDLEDGMRSRLISDDQIKNVPLCAEAADKINADAIDDIFVRQNRIAKTIMNTLVSDLIETSRASIKLAGIKDVSQVYSSSENVIGISSEIDNKLKELEQFLHSNLYYHPDLVEAAVKVKGWLRKVFDKLCCCPDRMPGYYRHFIETQGVERTVCDYIAGMTDRYCLQLVKGSN